MTEQTVWMLYSTFATRDEALSAANRLLEQRLIACGTVLDGATSVYRWQGEMRRDKESVLLAKTQSSCVVAAIAALKALHPYEVPAICAYPAGQAFAPFAQWVTDETSA